MTAYRDESFRQNEDFTSETIVVENDDGTLANLTGATATLKARYGKGETADLALTLTNLDGITLDPVASTMKYTVSAARALSMTPADINYTSQVILASGAKSIPVCGVWHLEESEV